MKTAKSKYIPLLLTILMFFIYPDINAKQNNVEILKSLSYSKNKQLKKLKDDIRKSIFTVKSSRPVENLPELKFYKYRVKKGDSFWIILSRTSMDMDTLISINSLTTPRDISAGKLIYIPNMRGIVVKNKSKTFLHNYLKKNKIKKIYVEKINRTENGDKKYLFIPCGKISNLERSLFLGTGFMHPLKNGKRTSGFGRRRNPFDRKSYHFHYGIDIACGLKSNVYAARSGEVIFSGYKGNYGKLVIVKHELNYYSYYGHLSKTKVKPGDRVQRGQVIALSGNTGRTTGPHLHFEIRKKWKPINPGILLRK